jgi:DNA-binding transcriptional MerR regulator
MAAPLKTFTIQEVSKRSGVSTHTLRFWEKELPGIVVPQRTKGGQRRYTLEHLLVIEEIKSLKTKGFSLSDVKRELNQPFDSDEEHYNHQRADVLANKIAELVRAAIFQFLEGKAAKE